MSNHEPRSRSERLRKETIFSMLSNRRRRYVLYYLDRNEGGVAVGDLAEQVAAWENDCDVSALTYDQRKRVYTSLHQTHLPKLDDADIVAYDRDDGRIRLGDRAADIDVYLELVGEHDRPWPAYYLALSTGALLALLAAWLGAFPSSGLALAGVVVVSFVALASVHGYRARRARIGGGDAPLDVPEED